MRRSLLAGNFRLLPALRGAEEPPRRDATWHLRARRYYLRAGKSGVISSSLPFVLNGVHGFH